VTHVVVTSTVDEDELAALRAPQDHFVLERPAGPDRFALDEGPFKRWERRVDVGPRAGDGRTPVTTTIDFEMAAPVWGPAFALAVRSNLRRTRGAGRRAAWMPPRLDARSSTVLAVLAIFGVYAGYLGVLLSQTNAFFKAEFGSTSSEIADAQIAVRIGALLAFVMVATADRWGRRKALLLSTVLGIVFAATGAFAPNLWAITASQGLARVFSSAMLILITLVSAEEMPAGARASALSILTVAGGLGAGGTVALLSVGGISPTAWRIIYLVPLPFLATVPALARRLPETRRFEVYDLHVTRESARPRYDRGELRRRLVLVSVMLLFFNLFIIPFAGFTNDFLLIERGFAAWQITLFQLLTNIPAGASLIAGGWLADRYGRKVIGVFGLLGGTAASVVLFNSGGWVLWAASVVSTVCAGLVVPSLLVYPTEMFPTGARGRANGITNLAAAAGAVIGLKVVGVLADRYGSYGPPVAIIGLGPVLVAVVVVLWFPETSNVELEAINPGDDPVPRGDELAALDRRWEQAHEHGHHLAVHEREPEPEQLSSE
jgi:MFS family permease